MVYIIIMLYIIININWKYSTLCVGLLHHMGEFK